jgi:hypothetical protein
MAAIFTISARSSVANGARRRSKTRVMAGPSRPWSSRGGGSGGLPGVRSRWRAALVRACVLVSSDGRRISRTHTSSATSRSATQSWNGRPVGHEAAWRRATAAISGSSAAIAAGVSESWTRSRAAACASPSPPKTERGEACGSTRRRASPARALPGSSSVTRASSSAAPTTTSGPFVEQTVKTGPKRDRSARSTRSGSLASMTVCISRPWLGPGGNAASAE